MCPSFQKQHQFQEESVTIRYKAGDEPSSSSTSNMLPSDHSANQTTPILIGIASKMIAANIVNAQDKITTHPRHYTTPQIQ